MPENSSAVAAQSTKPTSTPLWPVATVMATGVFATTFIQLQGLGQLPLNNLLMKQMGLNSDQAATFFFFCTLPWSFKFLAGLVIDSVPIFGSRRRSYLLLSAGAAALLWLGMGLAAHHYQTLLLLGVGMNIAAVFGSSTAGGILVEAGQAYGGSGKLSSLRVFAQNLGAALGLPVGGYLAASFGWTSAAAILPLGLLFIATWYLLPATIPGAAPVASPQGWQAVVGSIWLQLRNICRWQLAWPAALVFFVQAVPTFRSTCFYKYQTETLHYTDAALGNLGLVGYGVALLSSGVYAWACRKLRLRTSLYLAMGLIALSAVPYAFYAPYPEHLGRAMAIEGGGTFLQYLAYLPLFDLVVRATPKGSEALGYSALIGVWNLGMAVGCKTGPMLYENYLRLNMNALIWLNAGVSLAGVMLVWLIPKALADRRES